MAQSPAEPVVTHGEPHPGNLIRTAEGFVLVDWDTVAVDRAERDLWMLDDGTGSAWAEYARLTGRAVDPDAAALYRLAWGLTDLAAFVGRLRAPHGRDPDTERAWTGIQAILASVEPAPYGARATL